MARDVLANEGFENAAIQCKMAIRALPEAQADKGGA
jgi:hypothetical protein